MGIWRIKKGEVSLSLFDGHLKRAVKIRTPESVASREKRKVFIAPGGGHNATENLLALESRVMNLVPSTYPKHPNGILEERKGELTVSLLGGHLNSTIIEGTPARVILGQER